MTDSTTASVGGSGGGIAATFEGEVWAWTGYSDQLGGLYSDVEARFQERPPGTSSACETIDTFDSCVVALCDGVEGPFDLESLDAGTITVSGGERDVVLTLPKGASTYVDHASGSLFSGGETLNFMASGGGVPPFDQNLIAPSVLSLVEPDMTMTHIPRSTPLSVSWTGDSAGDVLLRLFSLSHIVTCTFGGSTGAGVVPVEALNLLPGTQVIFNADVRNVVELRMDDWTITLEAGSYISADGGNWGGVAIKEFTLR